MQHLTTTSKRWWLLIALGFFAFMTNLDGSIVNIAIPLMAKNLHVSASRMEWTVSLYLIVLSALLLPFGKLGIALVNAGFSNGAQGLLCLAL